MPIEEQVSIVYAGTNGFVDDYEIAVLGRYEKEMLSFMKSRKADLLKQLAAGAKLKGDLETQLREALTEFAKQFDAKSDKK
jgi:F-type H+-transporting ATPase subunit alpha